MSYLKERVSIKEPIALNNLKHARDRSPTLQREERISALENSVKSKI